MQDLLVLLPACVCSFSISVKRFEQITGKALHKCSSLLLFYFASSLARSAQMPFYMFFFQSQKTFHPNFLKRKIKGYKKPSLDLVKPLLLFLSVEKFSQLSSVLPMISFFFTEKAKEKNKLYLRLSVYIFSYHIIPTVIDCLKSFGTVSKFERTNCVKGN